MVEINLVIESRPILDLAISSPGTMHFGSFEILLGRLTGFLTTRMRFYTSFLVRVCTGEVSFGVAITDAKRMPAPFPTPERAEDLLRTSRPNWVQFCPGRQTDEPDGHKHHALVLWY